MTKQYAPSVQRNRDDILGVLRRVLPESGVVLEIASGSGEQLDSGVVKRRAVFAQLSRDRSLSSEPGLDEPLLSEDLLDDLLGA